MGFTIKKVFLLDGVGAIITGLMLSQVLARFVPLFGMPANLLFILSGLAFCFALYSLSCYLLVVENPAKIEVQSDGRIRKWARITEAGKYLRVILLDDGETVHNAFFDRSFKGE